MVGNSNVVNAQAQIASSCGMSPEERRATGRLLEPIKSECSLVIVEHDLEFIKDICDHLTVLDNGRVLDDGTIEYIEKSAKVKEVYTTRV